MSKLLPIMILARQRATPQKQHQNFNELTRLERWEFGIPALFKAENLDRQNSRGGAGRQECCRDADGERRNCDPDGVESVRMKWHVRDSIYLGIQRNEPPLVGEKRKAITEGEAS
jgi:hypothetical protein